MNLSSDRSCCLFCNLPCSMWFSILGIYGELFLVTFYFTVVVLNHSLETLLSRPSWPVVFLLIILWQVFRLDHYSPTYNLPTQPTYPPAGNQAVPLEPSDRETDYRRQRRAITTQSEREESRSRTAPGHSTTRPNNILLPVLVSRAPPQHIDLQTR